MQFMSLPKKEEENSEFFFFTYYHYKVQNLIHSNTILSTL